MATTPGTAGAPKQKPGTQAVRASEANPELIAELTRLPLKADGEFAVGVGNRSMAVVEHYDEELGKSGWKKFKADGRKWMSTGASQGPTDGYQAAWQDPKSGRVGVLDLWHTADEPEIQHGSFSIYRKGDAPL